MNATPLLDLFEIESLLNEEQKMVRDSVRAVSREVYQPRVQQCFRDETFPEDLIPQIGALGVLGANLDGYGCLGLDSVLWANYAGS